MRGKKFFPATMAAVFLFCLAFPMPALSLGITNISITPEIWLNDGSPKMDLSFACQNDSAEITNASAAIAGPNSFSAEIKMESFIRESQNHFRVGSYPLSLSKEGEYKINITCESGGSQVLEEKSLWVNNFSASVSRVNSLYSASGSSGIFYEGDVVTVEVIALTSGKDSGYVNSAADMGFGMYLGQQALTVQNVIAPGSSGSPWIIKAVVSSGLSGIEGEQLRVVSSYKGHTAEALSGGTYSVKSPIEVTILPPDETYKLIETTGLNITVEVVSNSGSSLDPKKVKFSAEFDGDEREIRSSRNTENNLWNLELTIPNKEPSKYSYPLYVTASYGNVSQESDQPLHIWFAVPFKGQIVGSSGNPVQGRLRIGEDMIIDTDQRGEYESRLTPGDYDIELILSDLTDIKYKDVSIEGSDAFRYSKSPIKYDSIDGAEFDAKRVIVLEFGYSFGGADINIPYDQYGLDKDKIKIYQCSDWNMAQRTCDSTWKSVTNFAVDNYAVSFSTGSFFRTAVAVSEQKSVSLEIDDQQKKSYYLGEPIILSGKIMDSTGGPVSGANITAKVRGTDIYASAQSGQGGEFELSFNAPAKEGKYYAEISGQKGYLNARAAEWGFQAESKKELAFSFQNYADIDFGKPATVTGSIINTGQKKISNISLSIGNPPFPGISISPEEIESLDIGEQKEVIVLITVAKDDCRNCQSQYSIEIKAGGDAEINSAGSFLVNMKGVSTTDSAGSQSNAPESSPSPNSGGTSDIGSSITGLLASGSGMVSQTMGETGKFFTGVGAINLVLIAVILFLGFKIFSRRRDVPKIEHRPDPIDKINDLKKEILKEQEEKK